MIRRLTATAAALLTIGGLGLVAAAPAHAACPTAGSTLQNPVVGDQVVNARTYWVDCGTYKRLQRVVFTWGAGVAYLKPGQWGNPGVEYRTGGNLFQAVNGYAYLYSGQSFDLGNRLGYEPIQVTFKGRTHPDGLDFRTWRGL